MKRLWDVDGGAVPFIEQAKAAEMNHCSQWTSASVHTQSRYRWGFAPLVEMQRNRPARPTSVPLKVIFDAPYIPPPEPTRIEQTHQWEFSPLWEKLQYTNGQVGGWCVSWLQHLLNFPAGFRGNAWEIRPNSQTPKIGSIVLFRIHAALIVGRIGDQLILAESNINGDRRILIGRTVPIDAPNIRGYFEPDIHTRVAVR